MYSTDYISRSGLMQKMQELYRHTPSGKIIPIIAIPVSDVLSAKAEDVIPSAHLAQHQLSLTEDQNVQE